MATPQEEREQQAEQKRAAAEKAKRTPTRGRCDEQTYEMCLEFVQKEMGLAPVKTFEELIEQLQSARGGTPIVETTDPRVAAIADFDLTTQPLTDEEVETLRTTSLGNIPVNVISRLIATAVSLKKLVASRGNGITAPPQDYGPAAETVHFVSTLLEGSPLDAPSAWDILAVCIELASFLMGKNKAYGDSALDPVRIMSSADPAEQIRVRMDDKLSRIIRGTAAGEDVITDLVGYWVLMKVAEKRST